MNIVTKDASITNTDDAFPGSFEVILSAPTKDRDGDTLLPDEWKQPLPEKITFDADHGMSVASTVGSGVPSLNEKGELVVAGTYSSLPRAQEVRTLVNEGHINTTSVAFMTLPAESKDAKPQRELLNGAFVAVPSNREALVLASKSLKAGARNSKSDAEHIQAIHDHAAALGATHDATTDDTKSAARVTVKSVEGSLEAVQDRARDALNDAYATNAYVWLRATLPDLLVFEISVEDSSETETYQQSYTDDGSVITLTGERTAVDLAEIVKPDPDEDAEPAAEADDAAAAKAAAASDTKAAADADSDAVTDEELEAKALQILAAQFIN
jgi:hypothetical protein